MIMECSLFDLKKPGEGEGVPHKKCGGAQRKF